MYQYRQHVLRKESVFCVRGRIVATQKITRYIKRHGLQASWPMSAGCPPLSGHIRCSSPLRTHSTLDGASEQNDEDDSPLETHATASLRVRTPVSATSATSSSTSAFDPIIDSSSLSSDPRQKMQIKILQPFKCIQVCPVPLRANIPNGRLLEGLDYWIPDFDHSLGDIDGPFAAMDVSLAHLATIDWSLQEWDEMQKRKQPLRGSDTSIPVVISIVVPVAPLSIEPSILPLVDMLQDSSNRLYFHHFVRFTSKTLGNFFEDDNPFHNVLPICEHHNIR